MSIKTYIQDLIYGRRQGYLPRLLNPILYFLSFLYRLVIKVRNLAYDLKIFSPYCPPAPLVISIGNIAVGGTGKTPAVLFTAKAFEDEFKLAILSRGYASPAEKETLPCILSNGEGKGPLYPASQAGDEPFLIAENIREAIVLVGKNRCEASKMAVKMGAKVILLDDGLQHRKLARDVDIVLVDAEDPFGKGSFLPKGLLRDEPLSLSRADLILLNYVENEEQFLNLKAELKKYSQAPVVGVEMRASHIKELSGADYLPNLKGKKVAIFCALGNPKNFKKTVLNEGAEILAEYFISDHSPFDPLDLEHFANECRVKGAEMLICTEKDQVKLPKYLKVSLPLLWIKAELYPIYDAIKWTDFINSAKETVRRRL